MSSVMVIATFLTRLLLPTQLAVAVAAVFFFLSCARWRTRTSGRPLPPGPPRLPIIGNMFNMPQSKQWLGYWDIGQKLGDVLYFQVLGRSIVVLNSAESIFEYLDKRSANTPNRRWQSRADANGRTVKGEHDLRLHALWTVVAPSPTRLLAILPSRCQRTVPANTRVHHSYLPRDAGKEIIKNVCAVAFEAGTDTVGATLLGMFSGVMLHPEVLRKVHAELDAVVGPHRLPNFSDKESLPYVNAIIKESMRWHSALPLGVPHATTADDEFRGYFKFIPAGTMLIPNTWACTHDPDVYEDPDVFRPERFIRDGKLDTRVQDPAAFIFGYGRRICPGRYFAESTLFINIACVLHVFDITPPLGEDGRPIKIEYVQSDTLISYPKDCRCTIKPRSVAAEALIRSSAAAARFERKN